MKKKETFQNKKIINLLKKNYSKYIKYLDDNFFDECYNSFIRFYDVNDGIRPEICYSLYVKKRVTKIICDNIKKENIDLEIDMLDNYINILDWLIKKLNIEENVNKELIISNAIESYDGNELFSIHLLNTLKNSIVSKNDKILKLK